MIYDFLRIIFILIYAACITLSVLLFLKEREFFWITVYILISVTTDLSIMWLIPSDTYNHFAFATGMIATSFAIYMYYVRILRTKVAYIIYALSFGIMLLSYLKNDMWHPSLIMPEYRVAGYYTIMAITSAYFLWRVIVSEKAGMASHPLWLGALFMVFSTLYLFCDSFMYSSRMDVSYHVSLSVVVFVVNFCFEVSKLIILSKLFILNKK